MNRHKRVRAVALVLAVTAGLVGGATTGGAAAPTAPAAEAGLTAEAGRAPGTARLQEILDRLTTVDGGPGALLDLRDRRRSTVLTSGVADVRSNRPVHPDSRFRIGSATKMFTATVLLQLVGEGRVDLDAPVERHLPGVVRGHGNDGRRITVRQLLQHTSGLPDFLDYLKPQEIVRDPLVHRDARQLVRTALAHPPVFEPGTGWDYSNTGYLLAGMIIEKVTGHPYGDEIHRRVVRPLRLRGTSVPGDSPRIPRPHPRGYAHTGADAPLLDITRLNPSVGGAAGEVISSGGDMNRFLAALLDGRLLRPAQLREMTATRPTGGTDGRAYGLGLESKPLPCGGRYWGHTGDFPGFETASGAVPGGGGATVVVNAGPGGSDAQSDDIEAAVETALCQGRPRTAR
ncbi:serine hydrolase domain-containing protein [Streptomyces mayonensis]|uniref:serine hydrolase domain-containing protein n=1 Tax=Streptomyces mayonensis TaxID=2750816 RepID=UPI001C1DD201|nr:serine hydrolase domain-containing protein [Streptomyces sp. A108]MBU6531715.1 beta-lactamase family protein [Streptomyces sp. A108]